MEKQVIFRDNQELQAADLNNAQSYAADSLQHIVEDAVSTGRHYTGGAVTANSATEVGVAALRLYNDGAVYVSEQAQTINLFQYLPLATKKVVAIVAWGQEVDTDVEPRDFVIDLTTNTTQPQAVAMQRLRLAHIDPLGGVEAADPQPPATQNSTLAIAYVYLTPTGIERIVMIEANQLPNTRDHEERVTLLEVWRDDTAPKIAAIESDFMALAAKTAQLTPRAQAAELASDMARVKLKLNLPSTFAGYDADQFYSDAKSYAAGAGYAARVDHGLLFPFAASAQANLALQNPYDAGIVRHADDLVLPAYTSELFAGVTGLEDANGVTLGIGFSCTVSSEPLRYATAKYYYGVGGNPSLRWWLSWNADQKQLQYDYRVQPNGWAAYDHLGWESAGGTATYVGVVSAQTMLVPNPRWLTEIGFYMHTIAEGDIDIVLCETFPTGQPNLAKTLAAVHVPNASLKPSPQETRIPIGPVFLAGGANYAIVFVTQHPHIVKRVTGNDYPQGVVYRTQNGTDWQLLTDRDMIINLYGARFQQPRTEVQLQPASLAGGISDLLIAAPQFVPAGCAMEYEMQIAGIWYPLSEATNHLSGQPDLVPLRAVLSGSRDLQPALRLTTNAITSGRAATSLLHWSAQRTLGGASTSISVQVLLSRWDAANHTITCALVDGATTVNPTLTSYRDEGNERRYTFTFAPAPGLTTYRVKLTGTRGAAVAPFTVTERIDIAQ